MVQMIFAWLLTALAITNVQADNECGLPLPLYTPRSGTHDGNSTFMQPIDHGNPDLGTFEQLFLWNDTFWKGSGSPIVVFSPGETNVTGFNTYADPELHLVGVLAQHIGAAIVIPEHRFFGTSTPFTSLTTANLTHLTVENSLKDLIKLAKEFQLPWAPQIPSTARHVPWILVGGSYSAAETAWLANTMPGTFFAYIAASPLIHADADYWGYMRPAIEYGAEECTYHLAKAIAEIDRILVGSDDSEIHMLKSLFGLQGVVHNDDFASRLMIVPQSWALQEFMTGTPTKYDEMCDVLLGRASEPSVARRGRAAGLDLREVLENLAGYLRNVTGAQCVHEEDCFSSHDPSNPLFTDVSMANSQRQYQWLKCNAPIGGWVTGAPEGQVSLISRLITPEYYARQCQLYFPTGPNGETYGVAQGKTTADLNRYTGGWSPWNSSRIIYSSGEYEIWRDTTVSSELRPGGPLKSDPGRDVVVNVIPRGWHVSDLLSENSRLDEGCRKVRDSEVAQICEWLKKWPAYM